MNILLLAPKNKRSGGALPDFRRELAAGLESHGHRAVILEHEPDHPGETLRTKFLRLASTCQQAVLVWPEGAAMATTADEVVLLQEAHDQRPIDVVLILHESEVELRSHEMHVHSPADQSRYLDGVLACRPFIMRWPNRTPFEVVAKSYADSFL